MTVSKYLLAFYILCCVHTQSKAQSKTNWTLPKHQIQLQGGMSNNSDFLGFIDHFANCPYTGATYYYNFSTHWYASLDYQFMQGSFKMGQLSYKDLGNNQLETLSTYPSAENPMQLPVVKMTQNRPTTDTDIKKSDYVKLNSPDGLYRRNHYNLNGGYMRVTPRNILRIGLGISYYRLESRDILINIIEDPYDKFNIKNILTLPHLRYLDIKGWDFNARIAYDFFITQKLSVGLQLSSLSTMKGFESKARQAGITVGYSPSFTKKKGALPKV
jgi:hypothetical protein